MEDKKISISAKQAFMALVLFISLGGLIYIGYYKKAHEHDISNKESIEDQELAMAAFFKYENRPV